MIIGDKDSTLIKEPEYKDIGTLLVENSDVSTEDVAQAVKLQNSKLGEILVEQGKVSSKDLDSALQKQKELPKKSGKKKEEYIRISLDKIDEMVNYFGEQVILQSTLEYAKEDLEANADLIRRTISQLSKITYDLQQTAISLRMVSIKTLFSKLERIVRDGSKSLGKEIEFVKYGDDCELDKNIMESIIDPLTHMVRNSVDHGIELPDDRAMSEKPRQGKVEMKAYPRGGFFYIEINDDGKGLDRDKIIEKAIAKKLIPVNHGLPDSEIYNLIFMSGFSTKENATELSGRGVGMDVVKTAIESLKGTCTIHSTPGQGTSFVIRLPQSLAIFNGMIVRINQNRYVLPNSDVLEIIPYIESQSRLLENRRIMDFKGEVIQLIDMVSTFKVMKNENILSENEEPTVLVVAHNQKKYGLVVNELFSQQRVVHKNIGVEVKKVKGISGGTILGDGKVALIIAPGELIANII